MWVGCGWVRVGWGGLGRAVGGSDVVLSICQRADAGDVARSLTGYRGVFVEANAITPARTS